jgi:hypothetical protein
MTDAWNCPTCRTANGPNDPACTGCGTERLRGVRGAAVPAPAPYATWQCGACETVNLDPAVTCSACGAAKGTAVSPMHRPVGLAAATVVERATSPTQAGSGGSAPPASGPDVSGPSGGAIPGLGADAGRKSRLPMVLAAIVVALALVVGVIVGVVASKKPQVAVPTGATGLSPDSSGTVTTTTTTVAPTTTLPVGLTAVDTSALPAGGLTDQVALTFETYFGGINSQNWSQMYSAYSPDFQQNNTQSGLVNGLLTSTDQPAALASITPQGDGSIIATVNFTSHQAAADGPNPGDTCDNWSIDYRLVTSPNVVTAPGGQQLIYFIDRTTNHTFSAC